MHLNNVGSLWLRRYAVFVAVCTFGLVIAGGLVTSNDAALSIPDWPLSWGHLVPTLEGGIRYEFAHRVTAMLVGLLTVGLAVWMGQASADGGADPLVRGRRPRRPAAVMQEPGSSSEVRVQGDPRGPGGPPHSTRLAWAAVAVVLAQAALGGVAVRFQIGTWFFERSAGPGGPARTRGSAPQHPSRLGGGGGSPGAGRARRRGSTLSDARLGHHCPCLARATLLRHDGSNLRRTVRRLRWSARPQV